jgi:hypothetical protein
MQLPQRALFGGNAALQNCGDKSTIAKTALTTSIHKYAGCAIIPAWSTCRNPLTV